MKLTAHTPQGTFESVDSEYNEQDYRCLCNLLSKTEDLSYITFETSNGAVYLPKEMVQQSVFLIEK